VPVAFDIVVETIVDDGLGLLVVVLLEELVETGADLFTVIFQLRETSSQLLKPRAEVIRCCNRGLSGRSWVCWSS